MLKLKVKVCIKNHKRANKNGSMSQEEQRRESNTRVREGTTVSEEKQRKEKALFGLEIDLRRAQPPREELFHFLGRSSFTFTNGSPSLPHT